MTRLQTNPAHEAIPDHPPTKEPYLGRDVIFDYLRAAGIDRMFGVPGTNEVPLIDGTAVPGSGVGYVPCLHENIALGAAMGHARESGRPGVVELHVTPGIGHAIGNLFNAAESGIPLLVLCGQQHSNLLIQEPLLASDLVQLAGQYTKWSYEVRGPDELALAMQRAIKVALTPPAGPVFLSIPWEFLIREVTVRPTAAVTRVAAGFTGDRDEVGRAAAALAGAERPVIVTGDGVGAADAWDEIAALAELLGAPVYSEQLSSYANYPKDRDHPWLPDLHWQGELPPTQQAMREVLGVHDVAFFCGFNAQAQVVIFDWDEGPLIPSQLRQVYLHNDPWEIGKNGYGEVALLGDIKRTLPLITEAARAHPDHRPAATAERLEELTRLSQHRNVAITEHGRAVLEDESTGITGERVALELARLQPDLPAPLTLANESISESGMFQRHLAFDSPSAYFSTQGGSLGFSMPAAIGIKLAAGDTRTVVNVIGDGSALFYPNAWWTAAKFTLPILYIVLNNRRYQTLIKGLTFIEQSYGWKSTGDAGYLRIDPPPELSFVTLAAGYGVDGAAVEDAGELAAVLAEGLRVVTEERRPYVVEVATIVPDAHGAGAARLDGDRARSNGVPPRLDVYFANTGGTEDPLARLVHPMW
ncbi:thiamine pyrophosphate-binding protein [Phytomonospora sp. NPDC050363]|uniref:thiamine pyrophosphate-binding protein n=1 Tax=Phytomonospora sp. NPDC050363 TaxID=3155642 RepID=UPI0034110BA0